MYKAFLFRHHWWLAILVGGSVIILISTYYQVNRIPLTGSVVATALAFIYFVQQQKLLEINLFKNLFTEFNSRYNELNDNLSRLETEEVELDASGRRVLIDYFNLCAEEYLFYKEGYIHRDVWRSWCRGMLRYLDQPKFRRLWDEEQAGDSYYGLTFKTIRSGAGRE